MILPTCPPRSRAVSSFHSTEPVGRACVTKIKKALEALLSGKIHTKTKFRSSKLIRAKICSRQFLWPRFRLCIFFIIWLVVESFRECVNRISGWNSSCLTRVQHGFWCCATLPFRTIDVKSHPVELEGLYLLVLDFSDDLLQLQFICFCRPNVIEHGCENSI